MNAEDRKIISSFLEEISSNSDSYYHHKELNNVVFLKIQERLISEIQVAEKRIQKLRKASSENESFNEAREYRRLLKLLGTTIAWILLEYDRFYIRSFASGHDSGFISGKDGLQLEKTFLRVAINSGKNAAILHDITNCLRVGDVSIIGKKGVSTVELKSKKGKSKPDRRERRQIKKGQIVRNFYDTEKSDKFFPNAQALRYSTKKMECYNWNELTEVIDKANKNGSSGLVVDECLTYLVFKKEIDNEILDKYVNPRGLFTYGCLDRHIVGLPTFLPFTCFEIPLKYKEMLLFSDVFFSVFVDLEILKEIIEKNGYDCKILKKSNMGPYEITDIPKKEWGSQIICWYPINRLIYECMSVKTFIDHLKDSEKVFLKAKKLGLLEEK